MEFANKITEIAEQEAHHPDLTISWGACNVEIWTHKIDIIAITLSILGIRYVANKIKVHISPDHYDNNDQHNVCLGQIEDQEALNS